MALNTWANAISSAWISAVFAKWLWLGSALRQGINGWIHGEKIKLLHSWSSFDYTTFKITKFTKFPKSKNKNGVSLSSYSFSVRLRSPPPSFFFSNLFIGRIHWSILCLWLNNRSKTLPDFAPASCSPFHRCFFWTLHPAAKYSKNRGPETPYTQALARDATQYQ